MTVTYIHRVHSASKIGAFFRLLGIWKGGVFKGIWNDFVLYFLLYAIISVSYRYLMVKDEDAKQRFEKICVYINKFDDYIPLSFLLGFYVTQVMNRWWDQFLSIPWVDNICMCLNVYMPGERWKGARSRIMRYQSCKEDSWKIFWYS